MDFNIENLSKKIDIGNYTLNNNGLILYCILKGGNVDASMLVSNNKNGVRMKEAMDADDLNVVAYLPGTKKFFNLEYVYDIPLTVPNQIEGLSETKSLGFTNKATSVGREIVPGPAMPVSNAEKNAHIENLKLSLTPDKTNLAVRRSTTLKGYYKIDAQRSLILYEDFYESERKAFKDEKSLLETLEEGKKSKKYVDEVKNAFAEARKKQKEAFIAEAKGWFEQEVTDFKDYKTDTLGVRHTAPDFVYSSSFNLGGLVKKAGDNIIIEIIIVRLKSGNNKL